MKRAAIGLMAALGMLFPCMGGSQPQVVDGKILEQLVTWSLGTRQRPPVPLEPGKPKDGDVEKIQGGPSGDSTKKNTKASYCMALPGQPGKLLIVQNNRLHIMDWEHDQSRPLALPATVKEGVQFGPFLASSTTAGKTTVYEIVQQPGSADGVLWQLVLDKERVVQASSATTRPEFMDQQAFYRAHQVPRCQAGGQHCLVLNQAHDSSFLDEEPQRGAKRRRLRELGEVDVLDFAWTSADDKSVYLITRPRS